MCLPRQSEQVALEEYLLVRCWRIDRLVGTCSPEGYQEKIHLSLRGSVQRYRNAKCQSQNKEFNDTNCSLVLLVTLPCSTHAHTPCRHNYCVCTSVHHCHTQSPLTCHYPIALSLAANTVFTLRPTPSAASPTNTGAQGIIRLLSGMST